MAPGHEWLESLDNEERWSYFHPPIPVDGTLFSVKRDHEPGPGCGWCREARGTQTLEVIE